MKWISGAAAVLAVCCMVMIYGFSAQENQDSQSFSYRVTSTAMRAFTGQQADPADDDFQWVNHFIRKTAHVSEYLLLALFLLVALFAFPLPPWVRGVIVYAVCITYAVTDEWHQTGVNARTGQFSDVAIDMIGVAAFMLIYSIAAPARARRRLHGKT